MPTLPGLQLRPTSPDDYLRLYQFQLDPHATAMAAFPARNWEAFVAHQQRIAADPQVIACTILLDGEVVGSIGGFTLEGKRMAGYWVGRAYWGRGIATAALSALLELDPTRPYYAYVAKHNERSRRVLEKCGFRVIAEERYHDDLTGGEIEELLLELG
ncbi:MAG: N-acetyltransferase [Chloroflexi bacterium]|nr:MAG: N-acetyltransferase [Chloroflexota bacterium]